MEDNSNCLDGNQSNSVAPWFALPALLLLYTLLVLPAALYNPMASFDEAWYGSVARNVLTTGDWMTFYYNGEPFWEKPPVHLWLTAASFSLFGVSDFSARLPTLLAGAVLLAVVFLFSKRQLGLWGAVLCSLLLLTAQDLVRFSAKGQMDVTVTLFITGHLLLFWEGLRKPHLHLLSGVCLGLAVATKNQVGIIGLMVQVPYILFSRDWRPLKQWQWYVAPLLGVTIAAPWFAHQYWYHGESFTDWFYYKNFGLYQQERSEALQAGETLRYTVYYLEYLMTRHAPLTLSAIAAVCWLLYQKATKTSLQPASVLFAVWVLLVPALFTLAGGQHYWYLMPMYPAVALLVGFTLYRSPLWTNWPRLITVGTALWAVILQASFYMPPPKQKALWAAKNLAEKVRTETSADQVVGLLHKSSRDRKTVHLPAAHYYFDRTISVHEASNASGLTSVPSLFVVSEEVFAEHFETPLSQTGNISRLAEANGIGLYRYAPHRTASLEKKSR